MQESQQNSCIQPKKLANKQGEIRFNWPVSDFQRLSGLLYTDKGHISIVINADYDEQERCILQTAITADLTLECQTTFEPIAYRVEKEVVFCTVVQESEFAEIEEYEPVLVEDGVLDIKQVVEDELILSVPLVANKPAEEVNQKMSFGELDEAKIAEEKKASNPFSVLKNLKKT
ncbi:YceD family protein [Aliikangiella sp. IMCC44359]|uniref:YceD family protein n=1 Tax=Aliikangiella sp. IMCC44359 TaxID=3459125 RepID=UPI00403ADFDB